MLKTVTKHLVLSSAAIIGLGILAPDVRAAIFFDQSLTTNPVSNRTAVFGTQTNADNFVPTRTGSINTIQFWAEYTRTFQNTADVFTVQFFNDVSGSPATSAFTTFSNVTASRTATGFTPTVFAPVFQFDLTLPSPVSVSAGTTYYLSITHSLVTGNNFGWNLRGGGGTRWFRLNADATANSTAAWSPATAASGQFAFNIQSVPESSPALALLAFGLVGVGFRILSK